MPLDGAAKAIEMATGGEMRQEHFIAHTGAHPLCYSVAYYLRGKERFHSFTDVFTIAELRTLLGAGYLLQPQEENEELFRTAIDRLWANGDPGKLLPVLKSLVGKMYGVGQRMSNPQRQKVVEENLLAVYLHSHMDEDTLDLGRLAACPDQVPDPEGRLIPACAYNLFYREKDPRFWCEPSNPNGHGG